ncbi:unnamed protein product, partial [Symbiodinium sp. CCMP2456]
SDAFLHHGAVLLFYVHNPGGLAALRQDGSLHHDGDPGPLLPDAGEAEPGHT